MNMNTAEVTSKLVEILKKITKRDEIELDMSLMDDMELESLDIFNVLAEAETESEPAHNTAVPPVANA